MPVDQQFLNAIENYLSGTATTEEKLMINAWYHSFSDETVEVTSAEKDLLRKIESHLRSRLTISTGVNIGQPIKPERSNLFLLTRIAAAAVILIFISIGGYFLLHKIQPVQQIAQQQNIAPGGNKAVLTLANGKKIILDNTVKGLISQQGGANIQKSSTGELVYNTNVATATAAGDYNTLSTPKGGITHVELTDGTVVWLNTASTIRYQVNFTGNERRVELLSGEAYFEVAHDKAKPFRVSSGGQTVEVLGTHFDINDYKDEGLIKTTLLQGSVRLTKGTATGLLKPGQQAVTNDVNSMINIGEIDADETVAWKDGIFKFDHMSLKTVMSQLARWYDVDVKYQGNLPDVKFAGGTFMNKNLSEVLQVLALNGIHCRVEGRTIIVNP